MKTSNRPKAVFGPGFSVRMNVSNSVQLTQAAAALALGAALGVVYDLLRALSVKAGPAVTGKKRFAASVFAAALDVFFWMLAVLAVFWYAMTVGGGQLRLYMLALTAMGTLLYRYTAGSRIRGLLTVYLGLLKRLCAAVLAPLRVLLLWAAKLRNAVRLRIFSRKSRLLTVKQLKAYGKANIRKERGTRPHEEKKHPVPDGRGGNRRSLYSIRGADHHTEPNPAQQSQGRNTDTPAEERTAKTYQPFVRTGYRL
jgi:hypothetical protein